METQKKQCSKCGEIKLIIEFAKNKKGKYGVRKDCKLCRSVYIKNYYEANKENILQKGRIHYETNKEIISQYRKDIRKNKQNNVEKKYKKDDKEYIISYRKEWYKNNRKSVLEKQKIYQTINKDRIKKYGKEWREINKEHSKKYRKEYYENNKESYYIKENIRRTIKTKAFAIWSNLEIIKTIYKDAILYTNVTGEKHEIDHIDPLQHPLICGLHVETNLQILTRHENRSKGNDFTPYRIDQNGVKTLLKIPPKWIHRCQGYYDLLREIKDR